MISEKVIRDAIDHQVVIQSSQVWTNDLVVFNAFGETEEGVTEKLLSEMRRLSEGCSVITIRIWPDVGPRPDGTWSGYGRASFT